MLFESPDFGHRWQICTPQYKAHFKATRSSLPIRSTFLQPYITRGLSLVFRQEVKGNWQLLVYSKPSEVESLLCLCLIQCMIIKTMKNSVEMKLGHLNPARTCSRLQVVLLMGLLLLTTQSQSVYGEATAAAGDIQGKWTGCQHSLLTYVM